MKQRVPFRRPAHRRQSSDAASDAESQCFVKHSVRVGELEVTVILSNLHVRPKPSDVRGFETRFSRHQDSVDTQPMNLEFAYDGYAVIRLLVSATLLD